MKKAEHKSSTDTARTKTQTNTESLQPEIIPDLQAITPENIVYLQRTIGNQATLRLLQRQQSPVKSRTSKPVVQRADTGLRDGGTSGDVATAVHAFASDPANAEKHPREIIPVLMGAINGKLTSLGVFPTRVEENSAGGNLGTFSFDTWSIDLNPDSAFEGKTKISELTEAKIGEFVNTIYHESRHCEQWFRIAQIIAGHHIARQPTTPSNTIGKIMDTMAIAADINKQTAIPTHVAIFAAMNPLEPGSGQAAQEAQDWYDSVYGQNSDYRDMVLGDLSNAVDPLTGPIDQLVDLINMKAQATTDYDRQQTQTQIDNLIMNIDALLQHVYVLRDGALQGEFDRLSAIGSPSAIETTMLGHAGNLINVIDQIRGTSLSESTATAMQTLIWDLSGESYDAYHDLPEEDDAHETGDAIEGQYNAAGAPAGP